MAHMALRRVPGVSGKYMADSDGLKKLGNSAAMSSAMVQHAQDIAGTAASVGRSGYGAAPVTVTAGWDNEKRAGAVAFERKDDWHWNDWRNAILKRTSAAMQKRG